jgi:hypothetical protein
MFGPERRRSSPVLYKSMPFGWLSGRHKVHRSIANEIATADFLERITQCGPIIRVVVAQKRFV